MSRISTGKLAQLLRRTGTSMRAGVDPRRVFGTEAQHGSAAHQAQLTTVREHLDKGDSLADSLRACDGYFPSLTTDLIDVGEQAGRLEDVMAGLADHYDHLLALRRGFLVSIAWPAFQLIGAVFVIGLLILVMGLINPDIAILGLSGPEGLLTYLLIVVMLAGTAVILVLGTQQGRFGNGPMRLALRIPVLGKCLETMALARLAWSLGMALDAGVEARRGMRLALRSTQNPVYASQEREVDRQLLEGCEFHEALGATGVFPDEFLQTLAAAEIAGTHGESLQRLAEEYRKRAQASSRTLTMAASFLIWGLVAALLIVVIFQIFTTVILQPYREATDFLDSVY